MDNKTTLLVLLIVLVAFITLLIALGIVFIVALRKRAPVVKIVMAPNADSASRQEDNSVAAEQQPQTSEDGAHVADTIGEQAEASGEGSPVGNTVELEEDIDEEQSAFVVEGQESVRYDRSLIAKIAQLKNESKDWYSELKNELLSYEKVKSRMSWRRETFRIGRMPVARIMVRGKTLCLMLAVEADGYSGTKYAVEDVSNTVSVADTPTLYRIKSARRLKYAKEMISGIMKELKIRKAARYEPKDFYIPYEGDMSFMQRGLVKRVVSTSVRTFLLDDPSEQTENTQTENTQTENTQTEAAATADTAPEVDNSGIDENV